ncbi:ATP-dependent RNA helicase [Trichinella pseudospiralis]
MIQCSTEIRTRIAGFKVQSASRYTMEPQVPPRFELGLLDSKSRVLAITPWNRQPLLPNIDLEYFVYKYYRFVNALPLIHDAVRESIVNTHKHAIFYSINCSETKLQSTLRCHFKRSSLSSQYSINLTCLDWLLFKLATFLHLDVDLTFLLPDLRCFIFTFSSPVILLLVIFCSCFRNRLPETEASQLHKQLWPANGRS